VQACYDHASGAGVVGLRRMPGARALVAWTLLACALSFRVAVPPLQPSGDYLRMSLEGPRAPGYVPRKKGGAPGSVRRLVPPAPAPPPVKEWVEAFEALQALEVRDAAAYRVAYQSCRSARRPAECFALLRNMVKDGVPRDLEQYDELMRMAAAEDSWTLVLDAYMFIQRKETVRSRACPIVFMSRLRV
jgi:hypothetical protein